MELQERRRPGRDSPGLLYCAAVQQYAVHVLAAIVTAWQLALLCHKVT